MKYFLLNLKRVPFVHMAHRHINDNYHNHFLASLNRAQITFIEQGDIVEPMVAPGAVLDDFVKVAK